MALNLQQRFPTCGTWEISRGTRNSRLMQIWEIFTFETTLRGYASFYFYEHKKGRNRCFTGLEWKENLFLRLWPLKRKHTWKLRFRRSNCSNFSSSMTKCKQIFWCKRHCRCCRHLNQNQCSKIHCYYYFKLTIKQFFFLQFLNNL